MDHLAAGHPMLPCGAYLPLHALAWRQPVPRHRPSHIYTAAPESHSQLQRGSNSESHKRAPCSSMLLTLYFRWEDFKPHIVVACSLFADVMREVGAPAPPPLPVAERQEIEKAGAALRRQRAAALTGAAAPFTAPLQVARVRNVFRV